MTSMMTLAQVRDWLSASALAVHAVGDMAVPVSRVHTDTRTLLPGDLFVALKGDSYDANDFLADARLRGASAAIANSGLQAARLPGMEVADSKLALARLAASWRAQFDLPMIAVAGSNGKTTVTQMIASILRAWKGDAALATEGNLNNEIGVPLTLLRLMQKHSAAVVELGMNHPGEIAFLADLTRPTVALVNNAQREHLEFMATVEAVAHENGSVINSLATAGTAVFPADETYTAIWRQLAGTRNVLTFASVGSAAGSADFTAQARWSGESWQVAARTPVGAVDFELGIAGLHNVKNALAAAACAFAAGAPLDRIGAGLTAFVPVKGRSRAMTISLGARRLSLVDDSYNANPDSMRAAIDVLAGLPGPRLLVMGDMGEVGDQGPQFHAEAGLYAQQKGIENLFVMGEQSLGATHSFGSGQHFDDIETLNAAVLNALPEVSSVLVKGSRFMKMERVVEAITTAARSKQQYQEEKPHAA